MDRAELKRRTKAFALRAMQFISSLLVSKVTIEAKQGEVVGIPSQAQDRHQASGAGKTTLLKVLSRITEPTEGYAEVHGWVGSLLEVGTGFHPELTGRENIYLNGAIPSTCLRPEPQAEGSGQAWG